MNVFYTIVFTASVMFSGILTGFRIAEHQYGSLPIVKNSQCKVCELQAPLEPVVEFITKYVPRECTECFECEECEELNCEEEYENMYESGYIDGEYDGRSKAIEEAKMYN